MKNANRNKWVRHALTVGILTALGAPGLGLAQDDDTAELGRIEVTGSRIRQAQAETALPVQVITREDIQRTGLTQVGDLLQRITASGSAINTRFNSSGNFGFPPDGGGIGAGATLLDLRNLGPKRVLVLVDGIRWVAGSSASGVSSAVDLNTIPIGIIERIEILKDGASSIYGSDAIAGVVNIITRKEFDGFEANILYGTFDDGEGDNTQFNLTMGSSGDDHSLVMSFGYLETDEISSRDRKNAGVPTPGTGVTRGSSGTPQGRFFFTDPNTGIFNNLALNNGVTGIPFFNAANPTVGDDYHGFTNDDRFNFSQFNLYQTPTERINVYLSGRYDLTDNITFNARAMYNNRQSVNQAAPEPIFIGPFAEAGAVADGIIISAQNPFNPFGHDVFADGSGFLGRRPIEAGPRRFTQDVDTFYFAAGLDGSFEMGNRLFDWDVTYAFGLNQASQIKTGALNARKIGEALDSLENCNANPGCVPLNLFGGQGAPITDEMLSFIQFVQKDESENELRDFTANLIGDLFDMPAGPLGFAIGYEHREQEGFFQPDAVVVAGDSMGVPSTPTRGKFDVDEFYGEVNIPILADRPGAELLDVSLAIRSSDYSTFGSETTGKASFRWQLNSELLFRGTFAEGLRAPSIGESFGNQSRFDAVLTDPCNGIDTTGDGNPDTPPSGLPGCAGVPGTYAQINSQISVLTGGNPNLGAETSDTITAGFIYSPKWAENLSWANRLDLEFVYYDIDVEGAIQAPDAQTILNQCAATGDAAVCSAINRDSNGGINSFQNTLTNIAGIETSGFDINIGYTSPEFDWGQITVQWNNTFVDEYVIKNPTDTGLDERDLAGLEENDGAIPEWKSNTYITWTNGDWEVAATIRHIDEVTEVCSDFLDGTANSFTALGLCSNPNTSDNTLSINKLDATTYFDLQVRFPEWYGVDFEIGANNLFDEDPPICLSCSLNGYDPSTYDAAGQFFYLRASYSF